MGFAKRLISALFFLSMLAVCAAATSADETVEFIYLEGLSKFAVENYPAAIADFTKVHSLEKKYKENNSLLYKSFLRQGDIEYNRNHYTEARKLYAEALGIAGETDGLLWRLKTIGDINEREKLVKENARKETKRFVIIFSAAGLFLILIFSGLIYLLVRSKRKSDGFSELVRLMPVLDESGNVNKDYYNDLVRSNRLKEILCAAATDSLSADLLKKYSFGLNEELQVKIAGYLENMSRENPAGYPEPVKNIHPVPDRTGEINADSGIDNLGGFLILADIVDSKTGRKQHSLHVAECACEIARMVNDPEIDPDFIKKAALIHDIGFLGLKKHDIINESPESAGDAYFRDMVRLHVSRGSRLVHIYGMSDEFDQCVLHHHEIYDGSGFPNGIKGENIPVTALIISAAEYMENDGRKRDRLGSEREMIKLFGEKVGTAVFTLISISYNC
jgi:putative nucleotidyltransferase with HDIG domain